MNGRTLRALSFSNASLSETEHLRSFVPPHAHELASFCFVVSGTFRERDAAGERAYGRRNVIFRAPGEPHSNTFDSAAARCFNVLFDSSLLARAGERRDADLRSASPILDRLLHHTRAGGSALTIEGLVLQLVGETFRPPMVTRSIVEQALFIIDTRFTEPLTIGGIAAEVSAHPVHLSRTFRRARGLGIVDMIRTRRIEYASALLRDSDLAIAEIALRAGFADQSHFTKSFRRVTDATPAWYRAHYFQIASIIGARM